MSKLKNMALWKKLLLSVVIMAAVGALTFWLFADVLAPHMMQIDVEIDPSNLTKEAFTNFSGVEPDLAKAYDPQKASVRSGNKNTASGYNMVSALMGSEAYVSSNCGHAFPADIDVTKEFICAECPAWCATCGYEFPAGRDPEMKLYCPQCEVVCTSKPACEHVFTAEEKTAEVVVCVECGAEKKLKALEVPTVNLVAESLKTNGFPCGNEYVQETKEDCGYFFEGGMQFDLKDGLTCPDCGYVYAKPAESDVVLGSLNGTVVTIGEQGFTCKQKVVASSETVTCEHVFEAGVALAKNGSLTCPDCKVKYTTEEVAQKLADAPVPACPDCGYAFPEGTDIAVLQPCPQCPIVCTAKRTDENGQKIECGYTVPADADRSVPQFCLECEVECGAKTVECGYAFVPNQVDVCPDCGYVFLMKEEEADKAKICPVCPLVCTGEKEDENGEKVACGYTFPAETDKAIPQICPECGATCVAAPVSGEAKLVVSDENKSFTCPECDAAITLKVATLAEMPKFSPKTGYQALVDSVKMTGSEVDVTFHAGEETIVCKEKLPCGHKFTALELEDLTKGLKCPDCKFEYIPANTINADLAKVLAEIPELVEDGFVCTNVATSKNICNTALSAGTLLDLNNPPVCTLCGHQYTKSELLGKVVEIETNKPLVMTFSMEYGSGKAAETRAAADLTLIAEEFSAQVKRMAETYNKSIEHKENKVGAAHVVSNTGVRTILATAVAVLVTGLALYLVLTKESFDLASRKELAYTVLVVLTILCIVFFYILFINATRAHADIQSRFSLLPGSSFMKNWNTLMANEELPIWRGMFNSLLISGCVALLSTYFSVLTAYAIHAYHFKLRSIAFKFILLVMMVPGQVSALGFVEMMNDWGWKNTFWPLILPSVAAPTVFFFMKQYMDSTLPLAIVEAARIDGSSEFGTFNRIVIHIMKPAIAVQAIFSFVGSWNNYFTPALLLNKKEMKTLPILIAQLRSADWLKFDIGQVYMMICLSILPVIIVYLCLSKFIIAGVAVGGVKE